MNPRFVFQLIVVVSVSVLVTGCNKGPKVATVTGVVTLDDKPIANASVSFYPAEGRASTGTTDENGNYELLFTRGRKGALLGDHKVTITTEIVPESDYTSDDDYESNPEDGEIPKQKETREEMLPPKYRELKSTVLTAVISSGENVVDFPLSSE